MKVQFISNLGSRDAQELGVTDFATRKAGTIHELPDDVAKRLLEFKRDGVPSPFVRREEDFVIEPTPAPAPAQIRAVPVREEFNKLDAEHDKDTKKK